MRWRTKIIMQDGWDLGVPTFEQVKIAHDGLRGHDLRQFVKRAGASAPIFLASMDRIKFASGEIPFHVVGLGAAEWFGANRNGDAFWASDCRDHHGSFVKAGKYFHDHKNTSRDPHYGLIKASAFNPDAGRVELLIGLYGTKQAADAHEGGRVAERDLDLIGRHKPVPVSMSCSIPFDKCSACGNEARTPDEYCDESSCPGGGCRSNLGKVVKIAGDLRRTIVYNPRPNWFDMSGVGRQADWIAYGVPADWTGSKT